MSLIQNPLRLRRKSQTWRTVCLWLCLAVGLGAAEKKTIVFFGDSLTAGAGVDPEEAYPALIQSKLDAAGLAWRAVNAGLSGETTAAGVRRLAWILRQPADVFVIALGGNDGLRGLSPEATSANLQAIIDGVRAKFPNAKLLIAGMQMPQNLGSDYTTRFAALYPELAKKNGAILIPFLLEGVGGVPALNQTDGIHPTPAGHAVVAETVWKFLRPLL